MTDAVRDTTRPPQKVHRLHDAMRRVRFAQAEREDAVTDLMEAERARLGMLAEELAPVVAELPEGEDFFLFTLSPGAPPRFWIDPTTHVVIGRDRRTYRFVKDSRHGRTVILESPEVVTMAEAVTSYAAERLLERERVVETDWMQKRIEDAMRRKPDLAKGRSGAGWALVAFLTGVAVGALGLVVYAWLSNPVL